MSSDCANYCARGFTSHLQADPESTSTDARQLVGTLAYTSVQKVDVRYTTYTAVQKEFLLDKAVAKLCNSSSLIKFVFTCVDCILATN